MPVLPSKTKDTLHFGYALYDEIDIYRLVKSGFIIFHGEGYCGEFLLVHQRQREKNNSRSWYGFPKGGVEKGETILEAGMRELIEEVGDVANECYFKSGQKRLYLKDIQKVSKLPFPVKRVEVRIKGRIELYYYYIVHTDEMFIPNPTDESEIDGHRWIGIRDLCKIDTNITVIPGLIKALNKSFHPFIFKYNNNRITIFALGVTILSYKVNYARKKNINENHKNKQYIQ